MKIPRRCSCSKRDITWSHTRGFCSFAFRPSDRRVKGTPIGAGIFKTWLLPIGAESGEVGRLPAIHEPDCVDVLHSSRKIIRAPSQGLAPPRPRLHLDPPRPAILTGPADYHRFQFHPIIDTLIPHRSSQMLAFHERRNSAQRSTFNLICTYRHENRRNFIRPFFLHGVVSCDWWTDGTQS